MEHEANANKSACQHCGRYWWLFYPERNIGDCDPSMISDYQRALARPRTDDGWTSYALDNPDVSVHD